MKRVTWGVFLFFPLFIGCAPKTIYPRAGQTANSVSDVWIIFAEGIKRPDGLALDSEGRLYVACEQLRGSVLRISSSGVREVIAKGLIRPDGVAIGRDGSVYVSTEMPKGAVYEVRLDGRRFIASQSLTNPEGLAFNAQGRLHVAEDKRKGRILAIQDGKASVLFSGLSRPEGIAFDERGNLYVNETEANQVLRIHPDGKRDILASSFQIENPDGLAYCPKYGGLFITEDKSNGRICFVSLDKAKFVVIAEALDQPQGVVCDLEGNLYVSEQGRNRILKMAASKLSSFVSVHR